MWNAIWILLQKLTEAAITVLWDVVVRRFGFGGYGPPTKEDSVSAPIECNLPELGVTVERHDDLMRVVQSINEWPLTLLFGWPGCGKTTLSKLAGRRVYDTNTFQRVIWISAKGQSITVDDIFNRILDAHGQRGARSLKKRAKEGMVIDLLRSGRSLIIIDNAETIRGPSIWHLIAKVPSPSRVLITTRNELHPPEEHVVPHSFNKVPLEDMTHTEAIELARLEVRRRALRGKDEQLTDLVRICSCNPLAISLACTRAPRTEISTVVKSIQDGVGDLHNRLFEGSWQRCSRAAQQVLTALAICCESVSREGIQRVTKLTHGACDSAIEEVTRRVPIDQSGGTGQARRYALHPLLQAFVLDKTGSSGTSDVRRRLVEYYQEILDIEQGTLGRLAAAYDRFDEEHVNMLQALEYCAQDPSLGQKGTRMVLSLARYFWNRGLWDHEANMLKKALEVFSPTPEDAVRLRCYLAWVLFRHDDSDEANRQLDEAESLLSNESRFEKGLVLCARGGGRWRRIAGHSKCLVLLLN